MDITFVVPAFKPKMKEESIGTLILAKKLLLHGYKVNIVRYWDIGVSPLYDYNLFRKQFVSHIVKKTPKIVSFYCRCEEYHICIDIAYHIKKISPSTKIVFGGPQAELVAKETISTFNFIDYICCSEGENTIIQFVDWIIQKNANSLFIRNIAGLTYRTDTNQIHQNTFPQLLPDNYTRPYSYFDLIPNNIWENTKSVALDIGRGCPFACTFCSTKTFWKQKFRLRNIDNIIDEIELLIRNYNIRSFEFKHDLFTVNKKRVLQFCERLKDLNTSIEWGCDSRIGVIDEEMIDYMVDSGLTNIFFGIETGSHEMQRIINKNLNLMDAENIVQYCLSKGLKVTTSFIYGFPEDTDETINATIKLAIRFQNYGCNVLTNMCHIMNGTELYARYKNELQFSKNAAFNYCIVGLKELGTLITNHLQLFANFCDYPNPLRQELSYVDAFRYMLNYAYNNLPYEHIILLQKDYASISMYRTFCQSNKSILGHLVPAFDGNVTTTRKILKHETTGELYKQMIFNLLNAL